MSPKPSPIPDPDPEFWQLDLDEQIRRARAYTCHRITQPLVEILVRELVDFGHPDQPSEDQIANLIHGARAFGRAEQLAQVEANQGAQAWASLPVDPDNGPYYIAPRAFSRWDANHRKCPPPRLSAEAYRDILTTPMTRGSGRQLAQKYGVTPTTITRIRHRTDAPTLRPFDFHPDVAEADAQADSDAAIQRIRDAIGRRPRRRIPIADRLR